MPASSPVTASGGPSDTLVEALRGRLQSSLGRTVQLIETHISWVLLDGQHAWKIKKPLRLGFLDFSQLAVRRHYCEEELRLNRRLAPSLYLDVVAVRGSRTAPRLDGAGEAIEYAVRMTQFAPGALFSERLGAGTLDACLLDQLALRLAAFQAAAPSAGGETPWGSAARIQADTAQVLAGLESRSCDVAGMRQCCEARALALAARFEARKVQGWVREGHGDLHLSNVVVLDDEVTAFDCIEFDPGLRWIDVQCDIAFLTMDLHANGRRDLAFRFLDRWLECSGDHAGLEVLRYYEVYRALVRALVSGIRSAQGGAGRGPDYLGLAQRLARPAQARLLITHGLSGSGKSFVSARLLEAAGAIRLRSDVERKRLFGLRALDDSASRIGADIYTPEATRRTYARLRASADLALRAGYAVIVDAAFLRQHERDDFRALAHEVGVPFTILHCRAGPELLRDRVRARGVRKDDASEADLAVLERQLASHDALRAEERALAIEVDSACALDPAALAARWLARDPRGGDTPAARPRYFDVCNGDADGLCAVLQWRLHEPAEAVLVTGLKRDIALLARVPAGAGDEVLVCDLSLQRNRAALLALLARGAQVRYFDHHAAGEVPGHPGLQAHIDLGSEVCTSVLMDRHLDGRFRAWAVVGAFGDNLHAVADRLADDIGLSSRERELLRMLGEAINYNAYGDSESDVHIAPARLYRLLARYRDPLAFIENEPIAREIDALRRQDLAQAMRQPPSWRGDSGAVYLLPDEPWSRRVIGSFANELAIAQPGRAHAVARRVADGALMVSVRAPIEAPGGAGALCARFGGAGRASAGGIDDMPAHRFDAFVRDFAAMSWGAAGFSR